MKKYLNAAIIAGLGLILGLLLVFLIGPRLECVYLHWRVISQTKGMSETVSEWADIYYTDQDKDYIPLISRLTDDYLPLILNDFHVSGGRRAVIVVYSEVSRFRAAVSRLDILPMGAYYGGVINIISPSLWMANANDASAKDYFIQNGPLIHELTHYAADLKYGGHIPVWLAEGAALYYEYKYTGVEWRPDLENEASEITMSDLEQNFRIIDERVAYRKAFDAVNLIVRKYGEDRLQQLLAQV